MAEQNHIADVASEPVGVVAERNSVDGLMAYILSMSPSIMTRRVLGRRLIDEADREVERLKYKIESQIRELGSRQELLIGELVKPSGYAVRNAIDIIEAAPNTSFLERVSAYPTDHATVMLKWIVGNIVASVDAGKEKFTYAIIDKNSATGISGEGVLKSKGDVENFYQQFVSLHYS